MLIDITNELYSRLKSELVEVKVVTSYPKTTNDFPIVTFEEIDNSNIKRTKDSGGFQHSEISFEINIFTTGTSQMTSAKKIRNQIDGILSDEYGMARNVSRPTPNFLNGDIYRYTMRYSAIIDKNKILYRG